MEEDRLQDQLTFREYEDPFKDSKYKAFVNFRPYQPLQWQTVTYGYNHIRKIYVIIHDIGYFLSFTTKY